MANRKDEAWTRRKKIGTAASVYYNVDVGLYSDRKMALCMLGNAKTMELDKPCKSVLCFPLFFIDIRQHVRINQLAIQYNEKVVKSGDLPQIISTSLCQTEMIVLKHVCRCPCVHVSAECEHRQFDSIQCLLE